MCDKCWRDSAGVNHDPATCGCDPSEHSTWTPPKRGVTELGGVTISERAKRLNEAIFELWGQAARLMVIQAFLDEEREEGSADGHEAEAAKWAWHAASPLNTATPARALAEVGATVEKADEDGGEGSVAEE